MFFLSSRAVYWPLAVQNRFSSSFRPIYWPMLVLIRFLSSRAVYCPLVVVNRLFLFLRKMG